MPPWLVEISLLLSLLIGAAVALTSRRQRSNRRDERPALMPEGRHVLATITQVHLKQGWKVAERWERNPWDGTLRRQQSWQTFYDLTAHWMDPGTKQVYPFRRQVWADEVSTQPVEGQLVQILVQEQPPRRSGLDRQGLAEPTAWRPGGYPEPNRQESARGRES
jgi:hypothetical protein